MKPEAHPMTDHPTLLELLENAAHEDEEQAKGAVWLGDAFGFAPGLLARAANLRAAAQRLREEMERAKLHPFVPGAVVVALNYINAGPLPTPTPPPVADPVEAPTRLRDDRVLRAVVDARIPRTYTLADAARGFVVSEILDAIEDHLARKASDPVEAVLAVECPSCGAAIAERCGQYYPRLEVLEPMFCASRIRAALGRTAGSEPR